MPGKRVKTLKVNRAKMGSRQYVQKKALRSRMPYKKFKRAGIAMRNPALMGCTKHYLASLLDPTSDSSRGACVPSGYPIASQKVRQFMRGSVGAGTTGVGYVQWTPSWANDVQQVFATTNTSVGTLGTVFTAFTNPMLAANGTMTTLPYNSAQCTSSFLDSRLVSGCLRVRYTGTEDTRGGIFSLLEEPDHNGLGPITPSQMLSYENCQRIRPSGDGEWATVCWSGPCRQSEVDYSNLAGIPGGKVIAILIESANGLANASYEWECWINIEYVGSIPTGKTESHVDPSGFSKVTSATKAATANGPLGSSEKTNEVLATIAKGTDNIINHIDTARGIVKTARKIPDWIRKGVTVVRKIAMAIARRGRGRF